MGKRSRNKGASFERRLAKRWRDGGLFPNAARRGEGQAKRDDPNKPPDIGGVPFRVEAKDRKVINVRKSLEQAEALAGVAPAIAVCHYFGDSMGDSIVCMRLSEWEDLVVRAEHPLVTIKASSSQALDDEDRARMLDALEELAGAEEAGLW